jgi:hypothetical protein
MPLVPPALLEFEMMPLHLRDVPLKPGCRARTVRLNQYRLPPELPPRTEVTLVAFDHGRCIVRDDSGREFDVFMACLRTPTLIRINRRWRRLDCVHTLNLLLSERGGDSYTGRRTWSSKWKPA